MLSSTIKGAKAAIKSFDDDLAFHFYELDEIVSKLPNLPKVCLAYCFTRLEFGYRRILYLGAVRIHRFDPDVSWEIISKYDINRSNFPKLYSYVFKHDLPKEILALLAPAESVRDRMIHGKEPATKELWGAVVVCLKFAKELNAHLKTKEGVSGLGKMSGKNSKKDAPTHPKDISRLALRGLGFLSKSEVKTVE